MQEVSGRKRFSLSLFHALLSPFQGSHPSYRAQTLKNLAEDSPLLDATTTFSL